ncbi:MAG: prepilin peptidase [Rhodospirillales bacterium]|nr:prepilin peptidase [Rhodospirillales bacterium]
MYFQPSIDTFVITLFLGLLMLAAINDVAEYKIPNRINFAIAALYPAYVLASPATVDWIGGLIVCATMLSIGVILFVFRRMGGGDVKMIAATALWAGPMGITDFVLFMVITGGVMAVARLTFVRSSLALTFGHFTGIDDTDDNSQNPLPYGVAIATGGFAVGALLLGNGRIV